MTNLWKKRVIAMKLNAICNYNGQEGNQGMQQLIRAMALVFVLVPLTLLTSGCLTTLSVGLFERNREALHHHIVEAEVKKLRVKGTRLEVNSKLTFSDGCSEDRLVCLELGKQFNRRNSEGPAGVKVRDPWPTPSSNWQIGIENSKRVD